MGQGKWQPPEADEAEICLPPSDPELRAPEAAETRRRSSPSLMDNGLL
jgi:hypothetical protein